jgi:uncharacterized protein (TIGR02391 family)
MLEFLDYFKRNRYRATAAPEEEMEAWKRAKASEYDNLYLEIDSTLDFLRRQGVSIKNPNEFRSIWDWYNAYSYPNNVCGQTIPSFWLQHTLYRPTVDPLKKALRQREKFGLTESEFLALLREEFGHVSPFQFKGLHEKIAVRCEEPFLAGRYDDAVFTAMKVVEDEVRTRISAVPDAVGVKLMSQALSGDNPPIRLSHVASEQEGAHALFRGAIGFFKNPISHRFPDLDDPIRAFEAISLASLLMRLLDGGQVEPTASA